MDIKRHHYESIHLRKATASINCSEHYLHHLGISQPQLSFEIHDQDMFIVEDVLWTSAAYFQSLLHELLKDKHIRKRITNMSVNLFETT